jgi:hypothetical protein
MPRRADLDPTEIPKLLPDVMLVDVLPSGRYRYRLIGTGNARAHGVNATGLVTGSRALSDKRETPSSPLRKQGSRETAHRLPRIPAYAGMTGYYCAAGSSARGAAGSSAAAMTSSTRSAQTKRSMLRAASGISS